MKVVFLLGNAAVGKMTVGQALMRRTGLRLFHNHMTIEPVIEIFGAYNPRVTARLRDVIFEEFAQSGNPGLIFTYMMAFDQPSDWAYIQHVKDIFLSARPDTTFYHAELVSPQAVRLQRNKTENRLANKASKRDIAASGQRLLQDDQRYRLESRAGEIPWENYIKIDNSALTPDEAAQMIQERFGL